MGLDAAELVFEVETTFDIEFTEDEMERLETVGDMLRVVLAKLDVSENASDACVTAATFFHLRRAVAELSPANGIIRPDTPVESTMPADRRAFWRELSKRTGLRFPVLYRPSWVVASASLVVFLITLIGFYSYMLWLGEEAAVLMGFVTLILLTKLARTVTEPFAIHLTPSISTYRGLVYNLVALNAAKLTHFHRTWNPGEVWSVLREVIAEQLGVDRDRVTEASHFKLDLGC